MGVPLPRERVGTRRPPAFEKSADIAFEAEDNDLDAVARGELSETRLASTATSTTSPTT
jgi:hypothetical protein